MEYTKEEQVYIDSLSEKERQAYEIAINFLKTSFDLKKSLGYVDYLKKNRLTTVKTQQLKLNS
jgi:hypothetical protein